MMNESEGIIELQDKLAQKVHEYRQTEKEINKN